MSKLSVLTIALPSGRIQEPIVELLKDAGIKLNFGHDRRSLFPSGGPDGVQFIVLRPEDAARMMEHGDVHAAFLGADMIEELELGPVCAKQVDLGLNRVRLCAAAPSARSAELREELLARRKLRVATKYPQCTARWAKKKYFELDILHVTGSVEAFTRLGYDFIVDVVDSGQTLSANALDVVEQISTSATNFVVAKAVGEDARINAFMSSLQGVLRARSRVLLDLNVEAGSKAAVLEVLKPYALKSVNEVPASNGSYTLRIAVLRDRLYDVIQNARSAGATGELVTPMLMLGE